jgi:alkyl hydroperoxide reductase subunit AhpC
VSRAYGVYREEEGRSGRALFVLDAEGAVRWSRGYPTNLNPGIDGMLTALETMQAQESKR